MTYELLTIMKCMARKFSRYKICLANFVLFLCTVFVLTQLVINEEYYLDNNDYNSSDSGNELKTINRGYDSNQTCKFPLLNPYDPSILPYVKHPFQIYCQNVQPEFTFAKGNYLFVDKNLAEKSLLRNLRYKFLIRTSEQTVRGTNWTEWNNFSEPILLTDTITVRGDYGKVDNLNQYRNIHASIYAHGILNNDNKKRTSDDQLSVFIFGFDSISRSNFIRNLPKTYHILIDKMKSHEFYGYSKIDDNTFPNLLALLTGHKVSIHSSELSGHFQNDYVDSWPFLWKNFSSKNYITGLIEEQPGFMSYKAKGFEHEPTDVYLRPYGIVLNETPLRKYSSPACVGNKAEARHYLDVMERFVKTYKNNPYFLFTFLWKLSHDKTSDIEMLDPMTSRFFRNLFDENFFNNTAVIVMSDHGNRFDAIRKTLIGRYEERMPFLSVHLPSWFRKKYPNVMLNLQNNAWKLTCQYDMYETLVDILNRKYDGDDRPSLKNRGKSLFSSIPKNRTCYDVHIPNHFCVCQDEENVEIKLDYVQAAAYYVVKTINQFTSSVKKLCRRLTLSKVISAQKYKANDRVLHGIRWHFKELLQDKNVTAIVSYLRVTFVTSPNNGIYEALVQYFSDQPYSFSVNSGDVSRINSYGKDADCISMINRNLEKFCYCKTSWL